MFNSETNEQFGSALTTTERGYARFALTFTEADVGNTYRYLLKEIVPETAAAGWIYSTKVIAINVTVLDNNDGTLSAVIWQEGTDAANATNSLSVSFQNIYDPEDAVFEINFVEKVLTGRTLKANEFTFEVQTSDGKTVLIGRNDANGKVIFNDRLVTATFSSWLAARSRNWPLW